MIKDLEDVDGNIDVATDICIIGGGVAGQTLAESLLPHFKVTILESGDLDFRQDVQSMASGHNIGEEYYPLEGARLRQFGGTAAIWGGRCAELDPIDFEKRDFIPHSGWPINKSDLDTYYTRAFQMLGLERPGEGRLWSKLGRTPPEFDSDKIDTDLWVFDEFGERFTNPNRGKLGAAEIFLNATLSALDINDQGNIKRATARSLNGKSVKVSAKVFVLAAGAIETVRLLLTTIAERPNGLGNDHDRLGRFFMEHPHARGGEIIPSNLAHSITVLPRALRYNGKRYAAYLRPSPKLQREKGILNTSLSFSARRAEGEKMEIYRSTTNKLKHDLPSSCLLYTSPSPRDATLSRMPSSA